MSSSVLQYEVMHVMFCYRTPLGTESSGYYLIIQILNVRFLKKKKKKKILNVLNLMMKKMHTSKEN